MNMTDLIFLASVYGVIAGGVNGMIDRYTTNERFTRIERYLDSIRGEVSVALDELSESSK